MPQFASNLLSPLQNVCGLDTTMRKNCCDVEYRELEKLERFPTSQRMASLHWPSTLPPPPPKLLEFSVQFGLLQATDGAFCRLRAHAGIKQVLFFVF